jgi:hypothetical protein
MRSASPYTNQSPKDGSTPHPQTTLFDIYLGRSLLPKYVLFVLEKSNIYADNI